MSQDDDRLVTRAVDLVSGIIEGSSANRILSSAELPENRVLLAEMCGLLAAYAAWMTRSHAQHAFAHEFGKDRVPDDDAIRDHALRFVAGAMPKFHSTALDLSNVEIPDNLEEWLGGG